MTTQRDRQAELKSRFAVLMGGGRDSGEEETAPAGAAETPPPPPKTTPTKPRARRAAPAQPRTAPAQPDMPAPVQAMPVTQAPADTARPHRLMVPLSTDEDRALKSLRLDDGIAAAVRMRAMLALYRADEKFRRKVDQMARKPR